MYEKELEIGCKAVLEAMRISRTIQLALTRRDSITKEDKSPVTIADYTAQAIICHLLHQHFPGIPIVGEEDSHDLQKKEHEEIVNKILHFIERDEVIGGLLSKENLFSSIDLGGGTPNKERFWTLDPVDGTKGFLRGEQYAIALALIEANEVKLGITGCPNLPLPDRMSNRGFLTYAIKGEGSYLLNVETGETIDAMISKISNPREMRFVESYVSAHSDQDLQLAIARELEMKREPVRMDSQVKYAVVASGYAEIYLRIPNPKTREYKEKIWDHAAGCLVVEEAGGIVTDIEGKRLDFSQGKTLTNNSGIACSVPSVHDRLIKIISEKK